jgi:processive 1,2-diacylglycerol beta-glucosyltransferase
VTKRFLIVSASIGGGHVAAGRAIEAAFGERGIAVDHVDLLDYTTVPFRRLYRQAYFDLVRTAPDFVDWLGKRLDKSASAQKSRQEIVRARFVRLISLYLPRLIRRYQPDVIIHTHFLAPEVLSTRLSPDLLRRKGKKPDIKQVVVITDYFLHRLWLQPTISHYFVGSDEVAVQLQAYAVPAERISITGIPIDLRFCALEPKLRAREALGYASDRDVLLLMASGLGAERLRDLLKQVQQLRWPATVAIICGRSPELLSVAADAINGYEGLLSFELIGFSDNIPRYMAAADLLIGKPGGLTTSEALAAGLPFAVVQPYPLQEEANTTYLLENGVGFRIEPLSVFQLKVKRFLADDARRQQMQQAAKALAKPDAARSIVTVLLNAETS